MTEVLGEHITGKASNSDFAERDPRSRHMEVSRFSLWSSTVLGTNQLSLCLTA